MIDSNLEASGGVIQDRGEVDPRASMGFIIREYITITGPADYLMFVDKKPVGKIVIMP